ncbi:related to magnaporin protein [Rhynchosporium agropyri]|uniref:Related to magnaporin protein n=1 Tax=Rhynchosporium agropyri TaxID=914238 RepID=A0A1E1K7M3_9HELO|nr:related to magnaporin protein [Rhynchosporium agropyri]
MQFSILTISLLAMFVVASPMEIRQLGGLCGSALDTPQCCDVSVGGIADLKCATPSNNPQTVADFKKECTAQGQDASCCVLPMLGNALVCTAM